MPFPWQNSTLWYYHYFDSLIIGLIFQVYVLKKYVRPIAYAVGNFEFHVLHLIFIVMLICKWKFDSISSTSLVLLPAKRPPSWIHDSWLRSHELLFCIVRKLLVLRNMILTFENSISSCPRAYFRFDVHAILDSGRPLMSENIFAGSHGA